MKWEIPVEYENHRAQCVEWEGAWELGDFIIEEQYSYS